MASENVREVQEAYLHYTEFKKQFDKLSEDDQGVLKPYLDKLFRNWSDAIDRRNKENQERRLK